MTGTAPSEGGGSKSRAVAGQLKRIITLGLGEGVARMAGFGLVAMVSRGGQEALGLLALAQAITQYVGIGADFGLKSIGARLVATRRDAAGAAIAIIERKRRILTAVSLLIGLAYTSWGPIPAQARAFATVFALCSMPTILALDWALSGLERFGALGAYRALSSILILGFSAAGFLLSRGSLMSVAVGTALGAGLVNVGLWMILAPMRAATDAPELRTQLAPQASWSACTVLGVGLLFNQAFHTVDSLLLGALAPVREVGVYAAAYKVMFLLFGVYYLFTQTAFPVLARRGPELGRRKVFHLLLGALVVAGTLIAVVLGFFAKPILVLLFGPEFEDSAGPLRILLASLPSEFLVAFVGAALSAWGWLKRLTICIASAAVFNVVANLFAIPRWGAIGAAWVTLGSYVVLSVSLLIALRARARSG